jgi:sugar/nucleoside kinase (ribokinase family)
VVVGDAAFDVVARPTGSIVPGDDVRAKVITAPGGAAANTAAWLAFLGTEVALVSRVGADLPAEHLRRTLTAVGVRCAFTVDPRAPTGCVVVLVDERGERSMLPDRGANALLRATDLDLTLLRDARHLHVSGYVLLDESSREAGVAALAAARRAGLTTSVDPQAANLISAPAEFRELVRGVDLVLPNGREFAVLGGAEALLDVVGAIAVTHGADGASWIDAGGVISVPAEPATCVDSTGAGDAFDAGLLAVWTTGGSPRSALLGGVRAGALAASQLGAQPSIT